MMKLTTSDVQKDLDALGAGYKTRDVDHLIKKYVKESADVSALRPFVLSKQQFHRIYFYVSLDQIADVTMRMRFIHENLLFSDWWHTDELIGYVSDLPFDTAFSYAQAYITDADPFIRRWGYVLFISKLCRDEEHLCEILSLMHDDDHYYVQMAQAWLIAELAVFFPEKVLSWMTAENDLRYSINGKAIQKICDSFRVDDDVKRRFKDLRPALKVRG